MPRHGPFHAGPQSRLNPTRRHRSPCTRRRGPAGRAWARRIRAGRILPRDGGNHRSRALTPSTWLRAASRRRCSRSPPAENGLAYAALGLLCFGPSKERNPVWERLVEETQQRIDKQLLHRSDYDNHWQAFNIAKAVARFSFGLSKKDETSRLIERMVDRINQTSSAGFFDDSVDGLGGNFNLYGVMALVFTRSALQLHANSGVRDRKLPTLRTYAEKYIRMMPDLVRAGRPRLGVRPRGRSLRSDALREPDPPGPARRLDPGRPEAEVLRHPPPAVHVLLPDLPRPGARLPRPARRRAHGLQGRTRRGWPTSTPRATSASGRAWRRPCRCPPGAPWTEPPKTSGRFVIFDKAQPQGAGPVPLPRRGVGAPPVASAHQLRREPLERRPPLPAFARASSTGRTTSTCRSCSPSSPSAST